MCDPAPKHEKQGGGDHDRRGNIAGARVNRGLDGGRPKPRDAEIQS